MFKIISAISWLFNFVVVLNLNEYKHLFITKSVNFIFTQVTELQKLDTQHKDLISVAIQYAEKLVNNKMTRQAYIDQEKANSTKREELLQKMETVRASL